MNIYSNFYLRGNRNPHKIAEICKSIFTNMTIDYEFIFQKDITSIPMSTGQRRKLILFMSLNKERKLIILDEALASLDPSLRSQMINLLLDLQQQMGLAYILISHNLGIVRHFSDDLMVLSNGQVVEYGKTIDILKKPKHKFTQKMVMSQKFQLLHK